MKKTLNGLVAVAVAVAATLAVGAAVKPPDEVVIDAAQAKRSAVVFPHAEHVKNVDSCTTCHHTTKGLTASSGQEVPTCTSCHLDPAKPGVPGMREMGLKTNPFHMGCMDCHKEQKKGPTKCDDCHPKN